MAEDLQDVSFMIPIKIESQDRINNINIVTTYLREHFNTRIIIAEQDTDSKIPNILSKTLYDTYIHYKIEGTFFHKTRLINTMTKQAKTKFVAMHDSDILMFPDQYVSAANQLRKNTVDYIYPFNGRVINISKAQVAKVMETLQFNFVRAKPNHGIAMGGCVMYDRNKFISAGMMNENFVSYGPEDGEQDVRLKKLGYRTNRINKPLYHLEHIRTSNSSENHGHNKQNWEEHNKIKKMKRSELTSYIKTWSWIK